MSPDSIADGHCMMTRGLAYRTAAIRTKWVMLILLGLGSLALWSGSEAVLPTYIAGMVLAGSAAKDSHWIRRLRTPTVGFLIPFYFIRAGTLVSLPVLPFSSTVVPRPAGGESRIQNIRAVSHYWTVSAGAERAVVLHADDVDRVDLRDHLLALWSRTWHRDTGAIFVSGRSCDCERGRSDRDCRPGVCPTASVAP